MTNSNNLKHSISVNNKDVNAKVDISLNDECKNGHQDFSITATFWEIGKPRIDKYFTTAGCCHDEILKHFPKLQIFVNLHLCDYEGIPTYVVENGFYHLTEGFNSTKPNDVNFESKFCKYYRLTSKQFEVLKTAKDKMYFGYLLVKLGVLNQWKKEAKKAIKQLENLTQKTFIVDSIKTQFNMTKEQLKEVETNDKNGFYTIDKIEERQKNKIANEIAKKLIDLKATFEAKSLNLKQDYEIDRIAIVLFNTCQNIIFYNHKNLIVFNWQKDSYSRQYNETEFKMFLDIAKENEYLKNCEFELN